MSVKNLKRIAFQYSNDNGATWSTALVLLCAGVDVYKFTETNIDTADGTHRKWENRNTYWNVNIELWYEQFDPDNPDFTTQESDWLEIQDWSAAALRRIYNADVVNYPKLDGYDEFNLATNTIYVNMLNMDVLNDKIGHQSGTAPQYTRYIRFELQSRDLV